MTFGGVYKVKFKELLDVIEMTHENETDVKNEEIFVKNSKGTN